MLESSSLLLCPWTPGPGPRAGCTRSRRILEPAGGQPLGSAWERMPASWWQRWLGWPTLEVHETQDEPLLFTVQRYWNLGPIWEVCDADGHRVGRVGRVGIEDRFGRTLAWIYHFPNTLAARFVTPQGEELGQALQSPQGTLVSFAFVLKDHPLAKMALLAAVLCRSDE